MINHGFKRWIIKITIFVICYSLLITLIGCEAVKKKFIRKPKKEIKQEEEVVLVPQEYPVQNSSPEEIYYNHYTLWSGWYSELKDILNERESRKRQIYCLNEIVVNLEKMRSLIKDEKQGNLINYIQQLEKMRDTLSKGINTGWLYQRYANDLNALQQKIRNEYAPKKIKEFFKP